MEKVGNLKAEHIYVEILVKTTQIIHRHTNTEYLSMNSKAIKKPNKKTKKKSRNEDGCSSISSDEEAAGKDSDGGDIDESDLESDANMINQHAGILNPDGSMTVDPRMMVGIIKEGGAI